MAVQHESGRAETPLRETRVPETRVPQAMTCTSGDPNLDLRRFESLQIEEIMRSKPPIGRQRIDDTPTVRLPQPCRDRRSSPNRIGLMGPFALLLGSTALQPRSGESMQSTTCPALNVENRAPNSAPSPSLLGIQPVVFLS
jgi:hypothetical protein